MGFPLTRNESRKHRVWRGSSRYYYYVSTRWHTHAHDPLHTRCFWLSFLVKGNSHSYTHLILALGIVREPTDGGLLLQNISLTRNESQKGREWRGSCACVCHLVDGPRVLLAELNKLVQLRVPRWNKHHLEGSCQYPRNKNLLVVIKKWAEFRYIWVPARKTVLGFLLGCNVVWTQECSP